MKRYLVLFDVHCPAHNEKIWNKVLKLCVNVDFFGLVLGGDFLDLYSLGSYNANSLKKLKDINYYEECEQGEKLLRELMQARKFEEKHYLFGNHCDRYFRELEKGDNSKYGPALQSPTELMNLKNKGFEVYENWKEDEVRLGKLSIEHGEYTNVHAAYKVLTLANRNIMFGHTHRLNIYVQGRFGVWNIGGLFDKDHPYFGYMRKHNRENWVNAFSIVDVMPDGSFFVHVINVVDDRFMFEGVVY